MLSAEVQRILAMIEPLPIEAKLAIVDKMLEDLHPPDDAVDRLWDREVQARLDEIQTGKVQLIPGAQVFASIKARRD